MLRYAALLTLIPTAAMADITGAVPHVIDGDTFELCVVHDCQKIRLCGIDAPEEGDPDVKLVIGDAQSRQPSIVVASM
ncbi:MAG: hypothetical protein GY798_20395 [Hyphomicrobiales bacterium]|nr:hypothetical protein [Hyphomicrobiales bacterium]